MYFIAVFTISWLIWSIRSDKSRVREMFGVAIWSSFLGLFTDLFMVHNQLWSYSGMVYPLYTIPLLLDFGIYPVVTYLFAQRLPEKWLDIVKRSLIWALGATFFEWVTMRVGVMEHLKWWTLWYSFAADNVIFWSIAVIYRFYRPAYLSDESKKASRS